MKFEFRSSEVRTYLSSPSRNFGALPDFVADALMELAQEVRGLQFEVRTPEFRFVRYVDRSYDDVCALVDRADSVWRTCYGRGLSREELISGGTDGLDVPTRDGFFGVLRYWHDFDEPDEPVYLCPNRYPLPYLPAVPMTTVGNICAAFGLAILDRLLLNREMLSTDRQMAELGAVWECAVLAARHNHQQILMHLYYSSPREGP